MSKESVRIGLLQATCSGLPRAESELQAGCRMAVEEVNRRGGVLGRVLESVVIDSGVHGRSLDETLRDALRRGVDTFFAGSLGDERNVAEAVIEKEQGLLWLGLPHEGMGDSLRVAQLGPCPNQSILPVAGWLLSRPGQRVWLLGSEGGYTRVCHEVVRAMAEERGAQVIGECVAPRGGLDPLQVIRSALRFEASAVFSTLDELDNLGLYRAMAESGWDALRIPVLSTSVMPADLKPLGKAAAGHLRVAGYFPALKTPGNRAFLERLAGRTHDPGICTDAFVTGYYQVLLWCRAVELAGAISARAAVSWLGGASASGPLGEWRLESNRHVKRLPLVGRWDGEGEFELAWSTGTAVPPLPWLGMERLEPPVRRWAREALVARFSAKRAHRVVKQAETLHLASAPDLGWDFGLQMGGRWAMGDLEKRYEAILNAIPDPAWMKDLNGVYLAVNLAWCQQFKLNPSDVVGRNAFEVLPAPIAERFRDFDQEVLETGRPARRQECVSRPDGQRDWYETFNTLLADENGAPWGFAGIARNFTHQKQLEEVLRDGAATLEERVAERTRLLAAEIEEHMKTEQELRLSRSALAHAMQELEAHIQSAPIAIVEFDNCFRTTRWSEMAVQLFGRQPEEVMGRDLLTLGCIHPGDLPRVQECRAAMLSSRQSRSELVLRNLRSDGALLLCEWYTSAVYDADGRLVSVLAHVLDITARQRDADALRRSEERLRMATLAARLATYSFDFLTGEGAWSEGVSCLIGRKALQPLTKAAEGLLEVIHAGDKASYLAAVERSKCPDGDGQFQHEFRAVLPDGEVRWLRVLGQTEFQGQGAKREAVRSAGVLMDITSARRAEDHILRLSTAIEQNPIAIFLTDLRGEIQYVNPKFTELTGYTPEDAVGQNPRLLKSGIHPLEFYAAMWQLLLSGQIWRGEICNRRKSGELYWSLLSIAPIRDQHGVLAGFVAMHEDVTLRKEAERQMLQALKAERTASETMRRFLSMTSHEFRTPLAAIQINSEMLEEHFDRMLPAARRKSLSRVRESLNRLRYMLDQVVFVNRAEQGRLPFRRTRLDLVQVVRAAAAECAEGLGRHHRFFGPEFSGHAWIEGDRNLLWTVFTNLLNNAVQYSAAGSEVFVGFEDAGDAFVVRVRDQGIGIPPADRESVFQMFERGSNVGNVKGTGLGLHIVRRAVEEHGGEVRLEPATDCGTTFRVLLPKFPPDRAAPSSDAVPHL